MIIKKIYFRIVLLLFFLSNAAIGQISSGGYPIQVQKLKSFSLASADLVVLPSVNNDQLKSKYRRTEQNSLKPFVFAHVFDVSLSSKNSGIWYETSDVNVWQLRIRSVDAFSLNFVFEHFNLPPGARLFLISAKTGEVRGAFTAENNAPSGIFATEPIAGDEIMLQYEEPAGVSPQGDFVITKVAHDFVGITDIEPHRPLGVSGNCNVNVNCDIANGYESNRDAVCRIFVISEVCSGTLVNNTAKDGIPYVLTAYHCIDTDYKAQTSVFLFNYEAPYCSYYNSPTIDGDVSRSISGSSLKASFDSLDFALVRLNDIPPYYFRAYLAGWNRENIVPKTTTCIHHPMGDIKKVAIDLDSPITKKYTSSYLSNGFWNIVAWDYGVTEVGSSGAPLFDQNKRLIGALTGGRADCVSRVDDYFEKFALSWNRRKETKKQLKAWLDPINSNPTTLDGMYLNSGKTLCQAVTNFKNNDVNSVLQISSGLKKGYYGGTNTAGFSEFAEQYNFAKNCEIHGISLGIAKVKVIAADTVPFINIRVYQGKDKPQTLLYSESYDIRKFYKDAMNYIPFVNPVKTSGTFYVSVDMSNLNPADTLIIYMANRRADTSNSFFLKNDAGWLTYNSQNLNGNGSALLTELVGCNVDDPYFGDRQLARDSNVRLFPNPVDRNGKLFIETNDPFECPEDVTVHDLLGKICQVKKVISGTNMLNLDFAGQRPGVYLLSLQVGGQKIVEKVSYIP